VRPPIDRPQLRALVSTLLRQALRPGVDARTGSRGHPLRQVIISLGFIGALFTRNAARSDSPESYLILLFAATLALTMLHVAPDPFEIRQRNSEIIQSRPVSTATLVGAQMVLRLLLAAVIASCFALLPLCALRLAFHTPWLLLGGLYLCLLLGSFTAVVLWLLTVLLAAGVFPLDRVRQTSQLVLIGLVLVVSFGSLFGGEAGLPSQIALSHRSWVLALPSTWFARLLLADSDAVGTAQRCGALALLLVALVAPLSTKAWERPYARLLEGELRARERAMRPPLDARVLGLVARIPLVGAWLVPEAPRAVATLVLTMLDREEVSRVKMIVPRVVAFGFFVFGVFGAGGPIVTVMLGYFGIASVLQGLEVVRQSSEFQASWSLFVAPLDTADLARGMRLAILVRLFLWHLALMGTALFLRNPPVSAALLAICYVVAARLTFAAALALRPTLPLSQEQRSVQSLVGFVASFFVNIVLAVAYSTVLLLVALLGKLGAVLAAIGALAFLAGAILLERLAAQRMSRLVFPA
jgi:hypothetical protein